MQFLFELTPKCSNDWND